MNDSYLNHNSYLKVPVVENKFKSLSMQTYTTTDFITKLLTISYLSVAIKLNLK